MSSKRRKVIGDLKKLITSAEEILDLKDELESRIVERGKGSGLRPTSVAEAAEQLELKKRQHKILLNKIKDNYEPFLMELIQIPLPYTPPQPPYTPQGLQNEPEPEPEPQRKRPPKKSRGLNSCCGSRVKMKKKQTKRRKGKKQTKKYKRLR